MYYFLLEKNSDTQYMTTHLIIGEFYKVRIFYF